MSVACVTLPVKESSSVSRQGSTLQEAAVRSLTGLPFLLFGAALLVALDPLASVPLRVLLA